MNSTAGDKTFVDTNIIIYAYNVTAGNKHKIAGKILADLWNSGLRVISTRVLQEFFVTAVQKIPNPITPKQAKDIVRDFLKRHAVVNNGDSITEAIDICMNFSLSFWDSMIIESAVEANAAVLLSENLRHGHVVKGVPIINPFR